MIQRKNSADSQRKNSFDSQGSRPGAVTPTRRESGVGFASGLGSRKGSKSSGVASERKNSLKFQFVEKDDQSLNATSPNLNRTEPAVPVDSLATFPTETFPTEPVAPVAGQGARRSSDQGETGDRGQSVTMLAPTPAVLGDSTVLDDRVERPAEEEEEHGYEEHRCDEEEVDEHKAGEF